jgi:toxin ParE1/3/4
MELLLAQSALDDLLDLQQYYIDEGLPDIGERFVDNILNALERLHDHPDSGRVLPEFDQPQIREILLPPYRVVYLRELSTISVIRVWREERILMLPGTQT